MADQFIRRVNLNPMRYDYAIASNSAPDRRALINEAAFITARMAAQNSALDIGVERYSYLDLVKEAEISAIAKIAPLEKRAVKDISSIAGYEIDEVVDLSKSILRFIVSERGQGDFLFSPLFPGCGMVSEGEGDLLVRDALCELKGGDRGFRSQDLRQVFTYICLNYSRHRFNIDRLCVVNPRRGVKFEIGVNTLCNAIAGRSFYDVASDLVKFMSEVAISR
ncbi:hypothetical protein GCM10007901_34160 [Dyella acidisoli]|uniref:Fido domain-containing protein n=2 Tax=Dyella acidisoli TaxID=1867834 RepID=A0ABQ5XTG6_9GAMM|nr:hypothetical protein GCM10007901_34160 [Dyella acidisoli]